MLDQRWHFCSCFIPIWKQSLQNLPISIETVYHLQHKPRAKGSRLEIQKGGFEMSKYAGTQTEKNLQAAFAGESQATNKYT